MMSSDFSRIFLENFYEINNDAATAKINETKLKEPPKYALFRPSSKEGNFTVTYTLDNGTVTNTRLKLYKQITNKDQLVGTPDSQILITDEGGNINDITKIIGLMYHPQKKLVGGKRSNHNSRRQRKSKNKTRRH